MTAGRSFTIRDVTPTGNDNVTVTVVDDQLHLFHVTVPRAQTADDRLTAIIEHALAVRYCPSKPTGG